MVIDRQIRVGMISLGCPKTLVDSEIILGKLDPKKYEIVSEITECEVAILNTCSFIREAQEESIDTILKLLEFKKKGEVTHVMVLGCLAQEFPRDLESEFKEVDAFIGSGQYDQIPMILNQMMSQKRVISIGQAGYLATSGESRVALTPDYYRYIKISEGCDHVCSFCTIPQFRGKHRSRTIDDVVAEARRLVDEGARELILTGQDTSYFGRDLSGRYQLADLLKELDQIDGVWWIRLLYAYPSCITDDLIKTIATAKKVCHYLDMPLQHASDRMLSAMKRGITKRKTENIIQKFRSQVKDVVIRTTFIVGFPGETDDDFEELLDFMRQWHFERLGIFQYSPETHAESSRYPEQIADKIKEARFHEAMMLQQQISEQNNAEWRHREIEVLVEQPPLNQSGQWKGRSFMDAPEVDGNVLVTAQQPLKIGSFYKMRVVATEAYDLVAEPIQEIIT